jgi:hypothetical protein
VHSTLTLLLCIPFVDGLIKVGLFPVISLCDYCAVLIIGLCFLTAEIGKSCGENLWVCETLRL